MRTIRSHPSNSQCMLGSQPPFPVHAGKPTPTPMDRTCENITLPQPSFAGGNDITHTHLI